MDDPNLLSQSLKFLSYYHVNLRYCDAIVEESWSLFVKIPCSLAEWMEVAKEFENMCKYPNDVTGDLMLDENPFENNPT